MHTTPTPEAQRGLRLDLDGALTEVTWSGDDALRTLQEAVGGYIEMMRLPSYGLTLVFHEEGKLSDGWEQRINRLATDLGVAENGATGDPVWDAIVGPVVVISNRVTPEGDALGLSFVGLSDVRCWVATGSITPDWRGAR